MKFDEMTVLKHCSCRQISFWRRIQFQFVFKCTTQDSIHMYMQQMAASSINTDQRLNQLGDHLGFMSQQNMAMFQQNQTLMQQMNTNRSGSGDDSGGYRTLKPRKEITAITADNAQALMEELDQFEVDLGELGLHLQRLSDTAALS